MNNIILYFFIGCIGARLALTLLAKYINTKYLPYLSIITLLIGLGFLKKFITYKNNEKGFFGNKVWWNNYRLIHSFFYLTFSVLAFNKYKDAYLILLIDTILGVIFFINKYFI